MLTPVREQDSTKRINRDGLKQLLSLDKVKSSNDISPLLFQGLKDKTSIYDIDIRGFVISQYIRLFLEYVKSFGQLKSKEDVKEVLNRIEEVIPLSNAKLDFPLHDELFGLYKFIGEEARLKMLVESNTK